ncbi:MAG TPA: GMC oxidoreductase [Steroidobacteraceae bacterium]
MRIIPVRNRALRVGLNAARDAESGVVDTQGAVFGIKGLYAVDGSVLPRSSRVNPSLSIYAWALRVAHLLSESLQRPAA